jgi:hypothetical protein
MDKCGGIVVMLLQGNEEKPSRWMKVVVMINVHTN